MLREAFAYPGPAVVEAVTDPNEPALPGHITVTQALHFAESLVRGEKYGIPIIKDVIKQAIREVV